MKTIIFATNNKNKVEEVRAILDKEFKILSLKESGIDIDIPEPFDSLEENAREKANVVFNLKKQNCFSEDTGLEVEALNGAPGVKSARYAGEERLFEKNIDKLLSKLAGKANRKAQFRTIICLISKREEKFFEGICHGTIIAERRGNSGFGYDAIFIPDGSEKSFAEMDIGEKNMFSHRNKAMKKLIYYLKNNPIS